MRFIKVQDEIEGLNYLAKGLQTALDSYSKITWVLSGGSNIKLSVAAQQTIPKDKQKKITVLLGDERFGDVNHKDSNYYQLENQGFNFNLVKSVNALTMGTSLEEATSNYNSYVTQIFKDSSFIIGQFGIGADGHTAGILPGSIASGDTDQMVIGYNGPDFQRITLSFKALKMLDEAYVFAFGESKRESLMRLKDTQTSVSEQPAQIFRQYVKESIIISNVIGV